MRVSAPPGMKGGIVLPRRYTVGAKFPCFGDEIELVPESQWDELAAADDGMVPFIPHVYHQKYNSCASESSTGALLIARAFQGLPYVPLNPLTLYRRVNGGRDAGSSIDENLLALQEYGVCPEESWSYDKGWRAKPSDEAVKAAESFRIVEAYDISTVEEMVSALLKKFVVVYGANGHAVCKVRHLNDREGLDLNSWGEDWGDNGLGVWASYRKINWGYGAWAVRTTTFA